MTTEEANDLMEGLRRAVRSGTMMAWCVAHPEAQAEINRAWEVTSDEYSMRFMLFCTEKASVSSFILGTQDPPMSCGCCLVSWCPSCCDVIRRGYGPPSLEELIEASRRQGI